jgi:glycolate oxidase
MLLAPMTTALRELEALLGPARAITKRDALLAYECDGFTIHRQSPLAVVFPESTAEVQSVLRILHRHRIPFVPRGAGTCLSGGPTPVSPAVVVELARMRNVLEVDPIDRSAVVQPGVVNLDLTTHVKHLALHYAPDPSSQSVCTIGGNVAENSGGPHCFKYGMTVDHLLGATVVLPDGEIAELGSGASPRPRPSTGRPAPSTSLWRLMRRAASCRCCRARRRSRPIRQPTVPTSTASAPSCSTGGN